MRRIPLAGLHEELGASFTEFAGWEVPADYGSAVEEHLSVRRSAGIFDISHMGRLLISGPDALELLELVYTKRVGKTKEGFMSGPTLALSEQARVKDDEMLYNMGNSWFVVPNAAAAERMMDHMRSLAAAKGLRVSVEDVREKYVLLALQGPKASEVMERLGAAWAVSLKPLEFRAGERVAGERTFVVSRSGWTGEDGFEIVAEPSSAKEIYLAALRAGARPAGIVARDTLRMEMGFVLLGKEYGEDPQRFPCAVSLRYGMGAIDWSKRGFVGEEALRSCRKMGAEWVRVGLVMRKEAARVIPREGTKVIVEDQEVGWVTSGTFSPVLERGIAQAYVRAPYALIGETVEVEVRGERHEAKVSDFPFIKR
ncbi:MAG: glycine cleavage system aminomethyltransferase GcvT [Acidilobaceae archaeon]|nr:glycine cleavage system aminomethyltransferase GcvT [Acidilobaceae archaeon]